MGMTMADLNALMSAVQALRDALHEHMDDNLSERVFAALRLRHTQAVIQARRETNQPPMPTSHPKYASVVSQLDSATASVKAVNNGDEAAMLDALHDAGTALDAMDKLP
jgi:hypothetical protein